MTAALPRVVPAAASLRAVALSEKRVFVAQLIERGFVPVPSCSATSLKGRKIPAQKAWQERTFTPDDFQKEHAVLLRLGLQPNDLYLYALDLDSHGPLQDAWKFLNFIHFKVDESLWRRFFEARSTGGHGRYIFFYTPREIANGTLHHRDGKAGEFLGSGRLVVYPDRDRWLQGSLATIPCADYLRHPFPLPA